MKILIGTDLYFYSYKNNFYVTNADKVFFGRYCDAFDKIRIIARTKIVNDIDLNKYSQINDHQIEVYPIPFFQGPFQYLSKYNKINKLLKRITEGCSAGLVQLPSTTGFQVLRQIKKRKLPYGVEIVANPREMINTTINPINKLLWLKLHWDQKKACANANTAAYVTKSFLQKIYPAKRLNHFETNYSSIHKDISTYHTNRDYPSQKDFIICHIAHPIKTMGKGHDILIKALKIVIDSGYENVYVKFAGDGELIPQLISLTKKLGIDSHVEFVGFLTTPELTNFLKKSDLMVFPSKSEGLPRVIIEAMAMGLPCISTNVGGTPELLGEDVLFHPTDTKGIANKIIQIINDPDLYRLLSKINFEKSLEYESGTLKKRRDQHYNYLKNHS